MLKFIEENDFLLVDTYKQNEDGSVAWVYDEGEGLPTHSGVIFEGFTRTTQIQDGVEEVIVGQDQEGNDITEEQLKMVDVEIDVWSKLHELEASGEIAIEYPTQEDLDAREYEKQVQSFKVERQRLLDSAIVTTTSGLQFDADEKSISRMANAIIAAQDAGVDELSWSLADTSTGVMTTVTLDELKEAHKLAVQNMADIWGI